MNENYEPCFYNVSDDWQERWLLIREFTTRWHSIKFCNRKKLLPLVKQEEDKLGFNLPPSVREYIMFAADLYEQERGDIIRDICQIKYHPNLATIELLRQCEDDAFWGIKEKYISQLDPPIELYVINYDNDLEKFEYSDRESSHLTSFVLQYMAYHLEGLGGGCLITIDRSPEFIQSMDIFFKNKAVFDDLLIYENENIISIVSFNTVFIELWKPLTIEQIPNFILQYKSQKVGALYCGRLFADLVDKSNQK